MGDRVRSRVDRVYKKRMKTVPCFTFDRTIARAFDDMVTRSIPFYGELQRMIGELTARFVQRHTNVYDLGCATGTTLCVLSKTISDGSVRFYGLDNSPEMLTLAERKVAGLDDRRITFLLQDLASPVKLVKPSVVIMAFTLQFLKPPRRRDLIESIHDSLTPNGSLILCEKVRGSDSRINRLLADFHQAFKRRNHYTELEIAQKRQALEKVLIPYRLDENVRLLSDCGFPSVEVFFRWFNFAGLIAVKGEPKSRVAAAKCRRWIEPCGSMASGGSQRS